MKMETKQCTKQTRKEKKLTMTSMKIVFFFLNDFRILLMAHCNIIWFAFSFFLNY